MMDFLKVRKVMHKIVSLSFDLFIHNLQTFFHATKHISYNIFSTLTNSIPIYNWLMDEIEDFQEDRSVKIRSTAGVAMEKLKKYYQKTNVLVYMITLSM